VQYFELGISSFSCLKVSRGQLLDHIQVSSNESMMTPDDEDKTKLKNFLETLLRLARDQSDSLAQSVRSLIQGLIDGTTNPEEFHAGLQNELKSDPQPKLLPFVKSTLPILQQALAANELQIEGLPAPINDTQQLQHDEEVPIVR